jgi:hypothetical protein
MKERENILRIFEEAERAIEDDDSIRLKELSDHTIHSSSITQDSDNIAVAVMIYSLSKIIERRKYHEYPGWKDFYRTIISAIDSSINHLKNGDDDSFRESLKLMRKSINGISGKLKYYIQDVFRKAQINKASRIYEHGISMEKTARLLGISMYELAGYAGQREAISEVPLGKTMSIKARIKIAEDIFGR